MTLEERIECGVLHALHDQGIDDDAARKRLADHIMFNIRHTIVAHKMEGILAHQLETRSMF